MKRSADIRRALRDEHILFCGYRWLAWVGAGLALAWSEHPAANLSRDVGLVLLTLVINLLATSFAQPYARLVHNRPLLLGFDILAGVMFVWVGGSEMLPFLPYALSSLVLPGLVGGWRGALAGALVFIGLDQMGLVANLGGALGWSLVVGRALIALAFAALFAALGNLLQAQPQAPGAPPAGPSAPSRSSAPIGLEPHARAQLPAQRGPLERSAPRPLDMPLTAHATVARATTEPELDEDRQPFCAFPTGKVVELATALHQLAAQLGDQNGFAITVMCSGTSCSLPTAQYSVLLRLAREALLNVQQHARAHAALLTLSYELRAVTMVVQDDGVGLLDGTYERPGIHALRALRYRLAELDGALEVFEGESGGVVVRATLPLDQ